ncbi:MAG: hypothetical protein A2Z88_06870 [Omnitrophica WOR_2 bacterium GWA2_47_8]|nr:MAG: hypothetical protein A2Z88_06870 [Omnitrophica WOR_2 bacterium GWA2_47_8]
MISSSHVFLLLMIAFLFDMKKGILETFLKVVRYGGVTLLTALPIFIWNFAHPGIGFSPSLLWWELIELRFLHHLAPFSWDIFKWIRAGAFVLVFLLALRLPPDKVYHAQIMRFVYGMLFLAAVATFFYYVVPLSILITLTFWRIAQFFTIFAMMYAANLIFQAYRKDLFFRIAAIGLGISLFLSNFKATLLFSLLLVALEHRKRPLISRCLLLAFILGMILATAGSFYVHIPYAYFFKIGTVPAILLLTLPLGAMVYEMLKGRLRNWQKASIQAAFLLFIVLFTIAGHILIKNSQSSRTVGSAYENLMEGYEYELKKTPPVTTLQDLVAKPRITATGVWVRPITIESLGNLATHPGKYMRIHIDFPGHLWIDDWRAVQFWAKDNTNRDAIFLVPPYLTDFRALSERAIVSDWDDMAMVNFHEEMGLVLLERFETVCNTKMIGHCVESQCLVRCRQSFNELGANQLKEIALRYQASYIIVEKPRILPLPLVFSNEGFSVYRVN